MKKSILKSTLGVGILFLSLKAQSQNSVVDSIGEKFICSNADSQTLTITNKPAIDGKGEAEVLYMGKTFMATFEKMNGAVGSSLFKGFQYEVFQNEIKVGTLNISKHILLSRGCGRGTCDGNVGGFYSTEALLTLGENEIDFSCQ